MRAAILGLSLLVTGCGDTLSPARLDAPALPGLGSALSAGPVLRSNRDIAEDILDLAFHPENGPELSGLLRFETPVRVALAGRTLRAYDGDLELVLARLRDQADIDIAAIPDPDAANIVVRLAPRQQMLEVFPGAQCFILPGLLTWSEFAIGLRRNTLPGWGGQEALTGATIYIPSDATPNEVRECFEEEIAQALGPANDLFRLRDSVFNDDNVYPNLTRFDMLALRALYDPALHSGMTRAEVGEALGPILAEINPQGRYLRRERPLADHPEWAALIIAAFTGDRNREVRRQRLLEALYIAERFPQPDHRLAYSLDLLAALDYFERPDFAAGLWQRAVETLEVYLPEDDLRLASMRTYLAQARLRLGHPDEALALVDRALPSLTAHATPIRLSLAYNTRARALDALGQPDAARAAAIDSDAWARYAQGVAHGPLETLRRRLETIRPPG